MYSLNDIDALDTASSNTLSAEQSASGSMNSAAAKAVATKFAMRQGVEVRFAAWQCAFTRVASAAPDFVSLEIIPAFPGSAEWQVIQRFRTPEALDRWLNDGSRAALLAELEDLRVPGLRPCVDEAAPDFHSTTTVTEVFTTTVKPGQEQAFRLWAERIQSAQARFPGYMGTLVQAPLSPENPCWTTLVRFEAPAFLDAWLESAERQALVAEATPDMSIWRSYRMNNAFSGWFANEQHQSPPPAWKQTCLVLLVLFPVVMLEIQFLSPLLSGLHLAVSTFIGNAISVAVVSWPLMAAAIFGLGWWLRPPAQQRWRTESLGVLTLGGLYALELLIFTHVL